MKKFHPRNKKKDLIRDDYRWNKRLTMCDNYPWKQIEWHGQGWLTIEQTTDFDECKSQKKVNDFILDECQWNKRLVMFDVYPYYQMNVMIVVDFDKPIDWPRRMFFHETKRKVWSWILVDETNECSWLKFTHKIRWRIWFWKIIDQANDWS